MRMFLGTLRLAIRNVMLHKMRSFLTLLGTILGVASVIAMLAVGEGSKQEALAQIRRLGANNVIIRSVKPTVNNSDADNSAATQPGMVRESRVNVQAYGITEDDFRVLRQLPMVTNGVPVMRIRQNVSHGKRRMPAANVLGTTREFPDVRPIRVRNGGRFISDDDNRRLANVAVLSRGAATRLFGYHAPLHQEILIGNDAYRVIGVLHNQDSGSARAGQAGSVDANQSIYIPIDAARSRIGQNQQVGERGSRSYERVAIHELTLSIGQQDETSDAQVRPAASMVRNILQQRHADKADYQIQVPLELMAQAEHEKRIWNIVLGSIAGISLLVGGIGIMNIMLATVTERTREIGIRRAIGAKQRDIIQQFLFETMVLSTTGGLLGIAVGITIPVVVTMTMDIETITPWWAILLAFGISVATGVIFGVYPAYKAARMNPIEALRHQ
ncbi:MAG: ABC transporter permease [Planctomycetota bacterium]